jgi:hypothetical protein
MVIVNGEDSCFYDWVHINNKFSRLQPDQHVHKTQAEDLSH